MHSTETALLKATIELLNLNRERGGRKRSILIHLDYSATLDTDDYYIY